ncbi:hypothetical protein Bbelb_023170 [Branchiostoma belcheri]|nr:hypothetical protein Bbelb_023170 [Branchiostoma belcheri]
MSYLIEEPSMGETFGLLILVTGQKAAGYVWAYFHVGCAQNLQPRTPVNSGRIIVAFPSPCVRWQHSSSPSALIQSDSTELSLPVTVAHPMPTEQGDSTSDAPPIKLTFPRDLCSGTVGGGQTRLEISLQNRS